jgi:hypothetical protein
MFCGMVCGWCFVFVLVGGRKEVLSFFDDLVDTLAFCLARAAEGLTTRLRKVTGMLEDVHVSFFSMHYHGW